ncbi:MAG: ATP cone domain-containing protein [Planctomycetota bacterium]
MARLRKVRARNGEVVPFSQSRVADSIREAVGVCGLADTVLADELANVVVLFLEKQYDDDNPPGIDDIRAMIGRVLAETGHTRISKAYLRLTDGVLAEGETPERDPVESGLDAFAVSRRNVDWVEVVDAERRLPERWDLDRLAGSLERDLVLGEVGAREIAIEVEAAVLASGLRRLPASLVRELTDAELASRAGDRLVRRHRLLGVSRRAIEGWLLPESGGGVDPEAACAERILAEYALDEIHSRPVSKAHVEGRIEVLGLGRPQRVERVAFDATGPLLPPPENAAEFLLGFVSVLQSVAPLVRDDVLVARFSEAFGRIRKAPTTARGIAGFADRLVAELQRDDVHGRPLFPRVTLEVHLTGGHLEGGGEEGERVRLLARALLDRLEAEPALARRMGLVFVFGADGPWPDTDLLARLLHAARRSPGVALELLREPEEAGRGSRHRDPRAVRLDVAAVAVNVPLALSLADVTRREELVRALESAFGLAVDALFEKYWYLRRSSPATLRGLLARLPGGEGLRLEGRDQAGRVLLWGLPQALRYLEARGISRREERAEVLGRILGAAEYFAGEERESIRLDVALGGVGERAVRDRLLAAAEAHARGGRDPELARALSEPIDEDATLPLAKGLLDPANAELLNSRIVERFGPGLELPTRGEDETSGGLWLERLFTSTGLRYLEFEKHRTVFERQESLAFGDADA